MFLKKFLTGLLLMSMFLWIPSHAQATEDPTGTIATEEGTTDPETGVLKYTVEEFEALSDDAKRDVYLNFPEQLPDNFSPEPYMDVFYPVQEPDA